MGRACSLALLAPLLLLLTPGVAYPRKREPVFGLRQLHEFETSANGRRMTHDFVHDDPDVPGRRLEVNYDVEVAPHLRLHNTDDEEHLASVEASADGKMRLLFDSAAAAAAFAGGLAEGDLLHGNYQDGPGEEAVVFPYHARVLASELAQETLHLDIDVPTLSEVFINAKASVMVALAPEDYYILTHHGDQQGESAAPEEETEAAARAVPFARRRHLEVTRRELGAFDWAKTWIDKQLQHIAKLGNMVLGVMDTAIKLVEFALTGNLAAGLTRPEIVLFDFNYDKAIRGPICGFNMQDNILPEDKKATPPFWGECRGCYAYSTVALRFEVDIANYEVNRVVAVIDGKLDFNMLMDELFVPSTGFIGGFSKLIKSIRTKEGIYVPLGAGVVLNVGAFVPVTLGVDMSVSGAASFSVDVSATASLKAGFRYVKNASPQQQMVNKVDYDFGGKGVRMLRWAGREVGVRLSLLPVIQLQLSLGAGPLDGMAHIGGPNFGLEASVAAMVTASNSTTAVVTRTIGMEGTIGANMTLRLGSDKSTDLLKGKGSVPPKGVYSKDYPQGRDEVKFVAFRAPTVPRKLFWWWDDDPGVMDDDAALAATLVAGEDDAAALGDDAAASIEEDVQIDAPDPAPLLLVPVVGPQPEWAYIGTTYTGTLVRIKQEWEGCSNYDLGGFIPPYLDITAVLLDYRPTGNGAMLDAALTFSYGKTEPSASYGEVGAFAAISQGIYTFSLYFSNKRPILLSCDMVNTLMAKTSNPSYPNVDYRANTTSEPIELPTRMYGGFCENGDKLKLGDTKGCISMVLDRAGKDADPPTSSRRLELDALPNEERRRKLGHMDRFPRILQQCAPPKRPTPSPTRLPTSRPPSNAPTQRPSTQPSNRPTLVPSTAPTQAPSTSPTRPPATLAPSLRPTASTGAPTTPPPSNAPTKTVTASPSPPPSAATIAAAASKTSASSSPTSVLTATTSQTEAPSPPPSPAPSVAVSEAPSSAPSASALPAAVSSSRSADITDASSPVPSAAATEALTPAPSAAAPLAESASSVSTPVTEAPSPAPSAAPTEPPSPAPSEAAHDTPPPEPVTAAGDGSSRSGDSPEAFKDSSSSSSSSSGVPEETEEAKVLTPEPIANADAGVDGVVGAEEDLAEHGDYDLDAADTSMESALEDDHWTQAVEVASEENYTKPPTTKGESTDDDDDFMVIKPLDGDESSSGEIDVEASGRPPWMKYAAGLGFVAFSALGTIFWLRKKWRAAVAWRTQQAAQAAEAEATPTAQVAVA